MSKKLLQSLTNYNQSLAKEPEVLLGDLGVKRNGKTLVSVPNRPQFVYVRLRTKLSELIEAFNGDKVAQAYDLPVKVKREGNRYVIIGRNTEAYSDWMDDNPYLPKHAKSHIFDKDGGNFGGDTVWVYPYQFMPGLVSPFGSRGATNVFIHQTTIRDLSGNWKTIGNTGTERLTNFNPVSGSCLVLINIDTVSGNPVYYATTGTFIPEWLTGTSQLISYLDADFVYNEVPDTFVRLTSGTKSIGWNNLHDVRQFLVPHPTGTSVLSVNGVPEVNSITFSGATFNSTGTSVFLDIVSGGGGGNGSIIIPIEGRLETGTNVVEPVLVTSDLSISSVMLYCESYGITGSVVIDVLRNNASMFSGSDRLSASFDYTGTYVKRAPYAGGLYEGDVITLNIDSKGVISENAIIALVPSGGGGSLVVEHLGGAPSVAGVGKLIISGMEVADGGGGDVKLSRDEILLQHILTNGTEGGDAVANTWTTLPINTESSDDGNHCSLASNQFTLSSGVYEIKCSSGFYTTNATCLRLKNTDDDTYIYGEATYIGSGGAAFLYGTIDISTPKTFELQYIAEAARSTYGIGVSTGVRAPNYTADEIYRTVKLTKVK